MADYPVLDGAGNVIVPFAVDPAYVQPDPYDYAADYPVLDGAGNVIIADALNTGGGVRPAWLDGAIVGKQDEGGALPAGFTFSADSTGVRWEVTSIGIRNGLWGIGLRTFGTNTSGGRVYPAFDLSNLRLAPLAEGDPVAFSFHGEVISVSVPYENDLPPRASIQCRLDGAYVDGHNEDIGPEWGETITAMVAPLANEAWCFFCDNSVDTGAAVDVTVWLADPSSRVKLGPELIVNGTFDTDTAWDKSGGWTIDGGSGASVAAEGYERILQFPDLPEGKTVRVKISLAEVTAGQVYVELGVYPDSNTLKAGLDAVGDYAFDLLVRPGAAEFKVFASDPTGENLFTGRIDNISVREILD